MPDHLKKQQNHGPIVESVRFPELNDGDGVSGIDFVFVDATDTKEGRGRLSTSTRNGHTRARVFVLQPPHEHIVCIRFNQFAETLTGVQAQSNLGRRSKFYGLVPTDENKGRIGTRYELYASPGEAIIGFSKVDGSSTFAIKTSPKPHVKRKKLRRMLLLPSVRHMMLKVNESGKSTASNFFRGGRKAVALHAVRHGLAGKMLAAGEDGDALVRLILDGEQRSAASTRRSSSTATRRLSSLMGVISTRKDSSSDEETTDDVTEESIQFPPSILRAMCNPGSNFSMSLMDLLSAGRERDGRPPLMRVLFESGVAKTIFKKTKGQKCIAELMMTPDRNRGLRSLMQLMTDDEAMNDTARPSLMRSMLLGEESGSKPSVLRLMFTRTPGKSITSIVDELMHGEDVSDSCARRLLTEADDRPVSLARLFFSDTASGKPALAKYVFGGESETELRPSMMRLMVQGEARQQNSLLRLLVGFRSASGKTLMDLLTSGQPSLMDIMLKGEESATEMSLARLMLGTTFTIQDGRLIMGSALGDASKTFAIAPSALLSKTTMSDDENATEKDHLRRRLERGLTISKACMLGEEDGGPGISLMRVLLMGEEQGLSVLRLLCTGEEVNEISPLRIILTGTYTVFVVAQVAADSSKEMEKESLVELATHPQKWGEALQRITGAVVSAVNDSHQEGSTWKESFEKLLDMAKEKLQSRDQWQKNIAFLYTAFARVRSMGPEFAKTWKRQWSLVTREIRLTGERVRPESNWKALAPVIATLTESIAEQHWQRVFLNVAQVIQAIERAAGRAEDKNLAKLISAVEDFYTWAPKWF